MEKRSWEKEKDQILSKIQKESVPFMVSFDSSLYGGLFKQDVEFFLSTCGSQEVHVSQAVQLEEIQEIKECRYVGQIRSKMMIRNFHNHCISDDIDLLKLRCYEEMIPAEMIEKVESLLAAKDLIGVGDLECIKNFYYRFFYGLKGQYTDPHYDWSAYGGILVQVFGQKEVILVSPEFSTQMPLVYNYLEMKQADFESFLANANIPYLKVHLKEAEGLYIPPYWIHGVRYLSHTLSLSLRALPRRSLYRLHKRYPANKHLIKLLYLLIQQNRYGDFVDSLLAQKSFSDFTASVIQEYKKEFDDYEPLRPYEREHEEGIFNQRQSFDYLIKEKVKMEALLRRGAASFEIF